MTKSFTFDELVEAQRTSYHQNIASGVPVQHAAAMFMSNMNAGLFTMVYRDMTESIPETPENEKNVHTEHCCVMHGCKYGDTNCPVERKIQRQSHQCEECDWDTGSNDY